MRESRVFHTIWGVSQLSAHHTGVSVVPEVITDGAPSSIDTHLHPTISVPTSNLAIQFNIMISSEI